MTRKQIYYHGESERLLAVGHPWHSVNKIPKVSPNQYRVFEVQLPDPNQFALPDSTVHNPANERLVWAVVGMQVSRGQPLAPAITGHPLLNVLADTEVIRNAAQPPNPSTRRQIGQDVKQTQVLLVGCTPAHGEYWGISEQCKANAQKGECPPIELQSKVIEDGDMMDIGYGAVDFTQLNESKADVPLDIQNSKCLYPDYLKMSEEVTGNSLFFYARKEQAYIRHVYSRGGTDKETPKENDPKYFYPNDADADKASDLFVGTLSGSLVATDGQIFNRPYWLYQAQGLNNGLLWSNKIYVTVGDNTRGGNITISVLASDNDGQKYDPTKINLYLRHVEEFKLAFILELCSVTLNADNLTSLQTMDPSILERWDIALHAPSSIQLENQYRYLGSGASTCAKALEEPEASDTYNFWAVDLKEKLSLDLDQFPLGRRFLSQQGLGCGVKRKATVKVGKRSSVSSKKRKTR